MPRYVALLRGINVGGNKKIPMADLRTVLTGLGYTDVRTHLQSGNAVFDSTKRSSAAVGAAVEKAIADEFGMSVSCVIRTGPELVATIEGHPFGEIADNGSRMLVLFLSANPDPALLAEFDPVALAPDEVEVGDGVIYQWCPNGILEAPPVRDFVEKNLKVRATGRNWNTVMKLAELAAT